MSYTSATVFHQAVRGIVCLGLLTFLHPAYAQEEYTLPGNGTGQVSPVIAEIDGNSANGPEIAIGSTEGMVHVVRADGTLVWSADLPNKNCANTTSRDKLYSSPAVGELFGNGVPYVVIGYGGFTGKPCDGGVVAFKGSTGETAWVFSIKDYAKRKRFFAFRHAVYGTPALADTDGDGKLEIGFGSFDRNVYLLNSNGSVRWYYNAADTVFSSPTFHDVDGDRRPELIIGTDISQNTKIRPPTPNGGFLYALRTKAKNGTLFNFRDPRLVVWKAEFDQVVQSSPVVGNFVSSNPGDEIVIGSGCFFPQGGGPRKGKWFKVVSARTGALLRTLETSACSPSAPAAADLDGDGRLEVVVSVSGNSQFDGDGQSHVIAWRPETDETLWDVVPLVSGGSDSYGGHYGRAPVIADLDGNGSLEVVVTARNGLAILAGTNGQQLSCGERGCIFGAYTTDGDVLATAAISDADGDGRLEVFGAGSRGGSGKLYRWDDFGSLASQAGPFTPFSSPWGMHRGRRGR